MLIPGDLVVGDFVFVEVDGAAVIVDGAAVVIDESLVVGLVALASVVRTADVSGCSVVARAVVTKLKFNLDFRIH
jgi:hypothetical protein